jgi:hypothetical protein
MDRKSIVGLLAALLLVFSVLACGNDDKATEAPAESPAASAEA